MTEGNGKRSGPVARPPAAVSVDVDGIDVHLAGYGISAPQDRLAWALAVPRLLELFAAAGVRATFFVIGRDAAAEASGLRSLVDAGHEVASHSLTHPMPLERLPAARLAAEVDRSRQVLADAIGRPVAGFRAPNWDVGSRLVRALVEAGYEYDASAFPTPLQVAARGLLAVKSRSLRPLSAMHPWPYILRRRPHRLAAGGLLELPISVTPRTRLPLYHTGRYLLGASSFIRHLDGFVARAEPFFYPLHAVDALGLVEDGVDPRLARHPGMGEPLEAKLALLRDSLRAIAVRFDVLPYAELTGRFGA